MSMDMSKHKGLTCMLEEDLENTRLPQLGRNWCGISASYMDLSINFFYKSFVWSSVCHSFDAAISYEPYMLGF